MRRAVSLHTHDGEVAIEAHPEGRRGRLGGGCVDTKALELRHQRERNAPAHVAIEEGVEVFSGELRRLGDHHLFRDRDALSRVSACPQRLEEAFDRGGREAVRH